MPWKMYCQNFGSNLVPIGDYQYYSDQASSSSNLQASVAGDNIVLLLQVARFLMKTVSQLGSGKKPVGTTSYMGQIEHLMQCRSNVQRAEDWLKPSAILEAFESRAARMSIACAQNLTKLTNPEEGFAELSADLVEAAVAHCQLIIVSKFIEKLLQGIPGKGSEIN
ncbi:Peroxisomal acyl-coenzyme A oxidase 1 [Camellia lanceoleosa]|uniref:Peroxisomal acyl-coenzyme A oxidase 1 n=1 Tax=Camellia lanceoleosa TaxID=1840588 RepID=A0ACC0HH74_9ERIC|nr:Peroxisomal acyl-coenzyme A oxidase 1 [Camellia lanceoleosa]